MQLTRTRLRAKIVGVAAMASGIPNSRKMRPLRFQVSTLLSFVGIIGVLLAAASGASQQNVGYYITIWVVAFAARSGYLNWVGVKPSVLFTTLLFISSVGIVISLKLLHSDHWSRKSLGDVVLSSGLACLFGDVSGGAFREPH